MHGGASGIVPGIDSPPHPSGTGRKIRTTLFTSANKLYEMFVLPYALGGLIHNDDARVEVCLEDPGAFESTNREAIGTLEAGVGADRFLVRGIEAAEGVSPNSVRFLETPRVATDFTYIGDIDVLILEAVSPLHRKRMAELDLPYSNVLRDGKQALSGLHWTRTDAYYPVRVPQGINLNRDEELLYHLVKGRGLRLPPPGLSRPMHGYHLSPNRAPLRRVIDGHHSFHWGLTNPIGVERFAALLTTFGRGRPDVVGNRVRDLFRRDRLLGEKLPCDTKPFPTAEREAALAKWAGAVYVGDKAPHLYRHLGTLAAACPDARFIYIVRHPYRVAASWQRRADNENDSWPVRNDFRAAVKAWNKSLYCALDGLDTLGNDRMVSVRYEYLFSRPSTMRQYLAIADWLGIRTESPADRTKVVVDDSIRKATHSPPVSAAIRSHVEATAGFGAYRSLIERALRPRSQTIVRRPRPSCSRHQEDSDHA